MAKELRVTLKKSAIGRPEKHRRVLVGLKLTKLNRVVQVKNTPEIQGMIRKVSHLLAVEEID